MEGSGTADLFIALSRIVSRSKSIDDICSDIAALVANSLGYKRCR
jgi:hypothetical protein